MLTLELVEILDRAVRRAFPDVASDVLREIGRWFWDLDETPSDPPADSSEDTCAFCIRPRRAVPRFVSLHGFNGDHLVTFCAFCSWAAAARFSAPDAPRRTSPDHVLALAIRAVRAEVFEATADLIADALSARHAIARPRDIREGMCLRCARDAFVIDAPGANVCAECLADANRRSGVGHSQVLSNQRGRESSA